MLRNRNLLLPDYRVTANLLCLKIPAAMEKHGIATERGSINRQIQAANSELRQLRARTNRLKKWLAEVGTAEPSLQDVFSKSLSMWK